MYTQSRIRNHPPHQANGTAAMAFARSISSWILRPQPPPSSPPTIFPTVSRHSPEISQMVLLFCVLDAEPPSKSIPVDIAIDKTVDHLRGLVKAERLRALIGVDAAELDVYRLPGPVRNTVELQREISALDLTADKLLPWDTIASAFPSPAAGGIQVLIRTPGKLPSRTLAFPHPFWRLAPFPVSTLRC